MIRVLQAGLQTTLQDQGRTGYASLGIARCGALDSNALSVANFLAGNRRLEAAIEIAIGPFEISCDTPTMLGISGEGFALSITTKNTSATTIYSNRSLELKPEDKLLVKHTANSGRLYIAVAGGFDIPPIFGSTATDLYGGFGGYRGRSLQQGDQLPCKMPKNQSDQARFLRIAKPTFKVRAIQGPEYALLSEASKQQLWNTQWQIASNSNRMAARLRAEPLHFVNNASAELLSHAVLPGIVQLPTDGLPIVLLADAQTTGGYPRIASVIEADLWQFAQMPVGSFFSFIQSNPIEARHAQQQRNQKIKQLETALNNVRAHQQ